MQCPLCNTPLDYKIDQNFFDCPTCKALVKDKNCHVNPDLEKARYKEHNNDVNDIRYQNFTARITNAILKQYSQEHLGLDYGCGTGPVISKGLQDKTYNVILYDPYFANDPGYLNNKYDYIFSCEVFEHFYHPTVEIEKLLHLLKIKGRLYVMTHQYDGKTPFSKWYYRKDPTHVFIYRKETFHFIAKKYKLDIEHQDRKMVILRKVESCF
jgi:SAM-dependent methyltransferase